MHGMGHSEYGGEYYYRDRPGNLKPMSDLPDWRIAGDRPDIRGWSVVDHDDNTIGSISDLLVDTDTGEVIFAVVSHGGFLGIGGSKFLVPLDRLDMDEQNHRMIFEGSLDEMRNAPDYTADVHDYGKYYDYWGEGRMPMEAEAGMPTAGVETGMPTTGERRIPEIEEHVEVGKREEQVGEVVARKEVETHPETVRVDVRRTRIVVTRRPVEGGRMPEAGEQVFREGEEIRIPVVEEKVVAETRPEVTGEVVIRPETTTETEEITRQVRTEHVEVETTGEAEVERREEPGKTHR